MYVCNRFSEYLTCALHLSTLRLSTILNIYNVTVLGTPIGKYQLCCTVGKCVYIYLMSLFDFILLSL